MASIAAQEGHLMLNWQTQFTGGWDALERKMRAVTRHSHRALDHALRNYALRLVRTMKGCIRQGGTPAFQPLTAFTLAIRKAMGISGRRPLLATRTLLRAIRDHRIGDLAYFVGVRKGTPYRTDRFSGDAATIALLAERGRGPVVLALDKASPRTGKTPRQWLWWLYFQGALNAPPRRTTTHVVIGASPERPFVRQTLVAEGVNAPQRILWDWAFEMERMTVRGADIRVSASAGAQWRFGSL